MLKMFKSKSGKKSREPDVTLTSGGSGSDDVALPAQIAERVGTGKSKFSISHSGRYKAKHKQRVIVDDKFYAESDVQTTHRKPAASSSGGVPGKQSSGGSSSKNSSGSNSAHGSANRSHAAAKGSAPHKASSGKDRPRASELEQRLAQANVKSSHSVPSHNVTASSQVSVTSHATAL